MTCLKASHDATLNSWNLYKEETAQIEEFSLVFDFITSHVELKAFSCVTLGFLWVLKALIHCFHKLKRS